MYNFIGHVPPAAEALSRSEASLHDYGKDPRPGRKVGHVTLRTANEAELQDKLPEWNRAFHRE